MLRVQRPANNKIRLHVSDNTEKNNVVLFEKKNSVCFV